MRSGAKLRDFGPLPVRIRTDAEARFLIRTRFAGLLLAVSLLGFFAAPAHAQQGQLDGNPSLFTVLAAINAAGYDTDIDSAANSPLRQQVRDYLARRNIASLPELKRFFAAHKQKNSNAELSQYVSFALSVEGPPDFNWRFKENELPPDVVPLWDLQQLLPKFYSEAGIEDLWKKVQPAYDQAIASYQMPVTQAVMEANAYLRNPTSGYLGRRFQIYVDLLGAPNQVFTKSFRDDYFVVLTPSPESQVDEIRHAYLHYLLDPLSFKFAGALFKKRGLIDYAQAAPALESYYKEDLSLLMTECLIKAVEARLARGGPAKQQAIIDQALVEGFVAAPALFELLPAYEKQDLAMRLYYPDLFSAIDLRKEERRLAAVHFAEQRAVKTVKVSPAERKLELTPGQKILEDAQALYGQRKLDEAREAYRKVLENGDEKALHARAYYGLARIAALQRDPELSEQLFRKTLESSPDPETRAWSLIYIARLADAQGQRERAVESYRSVLEVTGLPEAAREAAEKGLKESFKGK